MNRYTWAESFRSHLIPSRAAARSRTASRGTVPARPTPRWHRGARTRHEDHRQLGPDRQKQFRERRTPHLRHHDVGQQQRDFGGVPIEERARLGWRRRLQHLVASARQRARRESAHRILVFDKQDRRGNGGRASRRGGRRDTGWSGHLHWRRRQIHRHRRPRARRRVDRHESAGVLDDAVDERQPSPVPSPTSLVVKNGSKRCACTSALMPTPSSCTRRQMYVAGADRSGQPAVASGDTRARDLDEDVAPFGERVPGVEHEIEDQPAPDRGDRSSPRPGPPEDRSADRCPRE